MPQRLRGLLARASRCRSCARRRRRRRGARRRRMSGRPTRGSAARSRRSPSFMYAPGASASVSTSSPKTQARPSFAALTAAPGGRAIAPATARRRHRVRRGEVDLARRGAHAALEVARGRRDHARCPAAKRARRSRRTRRRRSAGARRPASSSACSVPSAARGLLVLQRRRRHQQAHVGRRVPAAQHACGHAQVDELGAGARADVGDVDAACPRTRRPAPRSPGCAARPPAARAPPRRRRCRARSGASASVCQRRELDVGHARRRASHVARHRVGRDQAGLPAELRGHVGERHALLHRQRRDRVAGVLHRLVLAAVHAEPAAQEQHHVLGGHAPAPGVRSIRSGSSPAP